MAKSNVFWDILAFIGYCLVGILAIAAVGIGIALILGLIGGIYWIVCYGLIFLFNLCGCGLDTGWMTMFKMFCGLIAFTVICRIIRNIFWKKA